MFDTLRECNSVVSNLNLSYNQLDNECMKHLGEYIEDNRHLKILNLNSNKIKVKGIEILNEHLIGNTVMKELHLSFNGGLTIASAPFLIEIAKRSHITTMHLEETSMSKKSLKEIKELLSIPIDQREIPIKSASKSATKIQSQSTSASS